MKLKYYSYNQCSHSTINIDSGIKKSCQTELITINEETIVASFFNEKINFQDILIIGYNNKKEPISICILRPNSNLEIKIVFLYILNEYEQTFINRIKKYIYNIGFYDLIIDNDICNYKELLINNGFINNNETIMFSHSGFIYPRL